MYLRQVGVVPVLSCMEILSCGVLGLLEVSVSAILCHGSLVVIFTAIFPLGYPSADVTFR